MTTKPGSETENSFVTEVELVSSEVPSRVKLRIGEKALVFGMRIPSSGFSWHFVRSVPPIVTVTAEQRDESDVAYGESARSDFMLTAVEQGDCLVTFEKSRRWEADDPDAIRHLAIVAVDVTD